MRLRIIPISLVLFSVYHAQGNAGVLASFPDMVGSAKAPDGRYEIISVNRDRHPFHSLFLMNFVTGKRTGIADYSRHVDVAWSKNSELALVNNYSESNYSYCIVLYPNKKNILYDIDVKWLHRYIKKYTFSGSHLYINCSFWKFTSNIIVSVSGYDGDIPETVKHKYFVNTRNVGLVRELK